MKVSIARDGAGKKYLHDLNRQGVTTSGFGFCQPLQVREMIAQDHVRLRVAEACRLQPVVKPTFGRLMLKTYNGFVPIEDLYHPYGSLLAGKSYAGAFATYIPTTVPYISSSVLTFMCYMYSSIACFNDTGGSALSVNNETYVFPNGAETMISSVWSPIESTILANLCDYVGARQSDITSLDQDLNTMLTNWRGVNNQYMMRYDDTLSLGSCDWYVLLPDENGVANKYVLGGRLTEFGKNIRKVLIGSGIQLNLGSAENVNFLKIAAYYKFWFDTFAIQRTVSWKNTNLYQILERIEQYNSTVHSLISSDINTSPTVLPQVFRFIKDLALCYYNQSPDYVSAHIVGTSITQDTNNFPFLKANGQPAGFVSNPNEQPYQYTSSVNSIQQNGLDILKKLYQYVNIKTAVGGRIADFMRSIFGSDYRDEKESNFIGASSMNIDINPVMSSAETSEGYLGEFAGQGYGANSGEMFDFTCSCAGYLITMMCIVPEARMCQGNDPDSFHLGKFDFFTSRFDALTLTPTRRSVVYNAYDMTDSNDYNDSFGNIPNYSEYKVNSDVLNGDVSMKSTRSSLLPFSMSKILPYTRVSDGSGSGTSTIVAMRYNSLVAGEVWRSVGRYRALGNYDRIFVNSGNQYPTQSVNQSPFSDDLYYSLHRNDDNFIIYFYIDLMVNSLALPISQSFQTDGFQDSIKVEKA